MSYHEFHATEFTPGSLSHTSALALLPLRAHFINEYYMLSGAAVMSLGASAPRHATLDAVHHVVVVPNTAYHEVAW